MALQWRMQKPRECNAKQVYSMTKVCHLQVPLSDRAAQASSSVVQWDKNSNLTGLLKSVGMVRHILALLCSVVSLFYYNVCHHLSFSV